MNPRFKIGDQVWRARFDASKGYVTCPDCGGTGRLRVTFHDETTVSIECRNCAVGYDPPTGRVVCHERHPGAEQFTVTGMEMTATKVTYHLGGTESFHYLADENEIFAAQEDALARSQVQADEASEEERKKIFRKERDTRTWAWNASYHRGVIKRAKHDLEYLTAKLNVASLKAKEDRTKS
ncbi:MAG: hypothetical protein WC829_14305 [Hyphomicrobium sp.]|jgi:hypothetical protein